MIARIALLYSTLAFLPTASFALTSVDVQSFHVGFLHPNGVDVIGYSSEKPLSNHFYRFYSFGFPSLAAIGINYYNDFDGDGVSANVGIGVGSVLYSSMCYRWLAFHSSSFRLGAGYTTSIVYNGWYPVLAFEARF